MRRRQQWLGAGVALVTLMSTVVVLATTFELVQVNSSNIVAKLWPTSSINWVLNPTNGIVYIAGTSSAGSTLAASTDLSTLVGGAFTLWSGATYQSKLANSLSITQGANSAANNSFNGADCVNTIGFTQDLGASIIGETQVGTVITGTPGSPVGSYSFSPACTGTCPYQVCIIDADIEFNTEFRFYTPAYATPPSSYFDLRTVATHEIGHLIGLDHSGLASAIMFPYGDSGNGGAKAALTSDDIIGSAQLYPNNTSGIQALLGEIDGNVTLNGSAAFAAHVAAVDTTTGDVITDTFTDPLGNYRMETFAGTYNVVVLPLASDLNHGIITLGNFTGLTAGYPGAPNPPPTNYTVTVY